MTPRAVKERDHEQDASKCLGQDPPVQVMAMLVG
jgi:hypothetical protein